MKTRMKLATLTIKQRGQPPATSAEIGARERYLMVMLSGMLPCLADLQVSELQLRAASDASVERWQLCLVPRTQRLLGEAYGLDGKLDQDAEMLFGDLKSLLARLSRVLREVKVDLETANVPLRYRKALHTICLRAERSSWSFDLQTRQFQLPLDGSLQSRLDACVMTARARLEKVCKRRVVLSHVEFSDLGGDGRVVDRMPWLEVHVAEHESGALLLVNHRQLFLNQIWEGSVKLRRSTVRGEVLGGMLCVETVESDP